MDLLVTRRLIWFQMFSRLRQLFSSPKPAPKAPPVFALPEGVRVYAVGDIHGRSALLRDMLAAIESDAKKHPGKKIVEVFLGDYVDRGLHSREVVELLLAPPANGHERVCLMGNHEEVLLQFLEDPSVFRDWVHFGGYATLASYGVPVPPSVTPETLNILSDALLRGIPKAHLEFFKKLHLNYNLGNYLFVHAGIVPGIPLEQQTQRDMLWIRGQFLRHRDYFDHYIVHGHSPVAAPEVYANRANLDVSAAEVSSLCCLVIEGTARATMVVINDKD